MKITELGHRRADNPAGPGLAKKRNNRHEDYSTNDTAMSEPTPTSEQEQRARWDLLLLDIHLRTLQVIEMKRFATWKAIAGFATAVAAVAGVIVGVAHFLLH